MTCRPAGRTRSAATRRCTRGSTTPGSRRARGRGPGRCRRRCPRRTQGDGEDAQPGGDAGGAAEGLLDGLDDGAAGHDPDADAHVGEISISAVDRAMTQIRRVVVAAAGLHGRDQVAGPELPGADDEGRAHQAEHAEELVAAGPGRGRVGTASGAWDTWRAWRRGRPRRAVTFGGGCGRAAAGEWGADDSDMVDHVSSLSAAWPRSSSGRARSPSRGGGCARRWSGVGRGGSTPPPAVLTAVSRARTRVSDVARAQTSSACLSASVISPRRPRARAAAAAGGRWRGRAPRGPRARA